MFKLKISIITISVVVALFSSCTKEANNSNTISKGGLKSSSPVENLQHLNNLLAVQSVNTMITDKYSLDLQNTSGMYNFDHTTGQTLTNEYIFVIPASLNSGSNPNEQHKVIIICLLNEGKAVIMEESKNLMTNGNYSIRLNLIGNPSSEDCQYIVNQNGILIEKAGPCGDIDNWWDCMKCVYNDYTSNLVGQLTWIPVGCSVASAYCALIFPPPTWSYTLPA